MGGYTYAHTYNIILYGLATCLVLCYAYLQDKHDNKYNIYAIEGIKQKRTGYFKVKINDGAITVYLYL